MRRACSALLVVQQGTIPYLHGNDSLPHVGAPRGLWVQTAFPKAIASVYQASKNIPVLRPRVSLAKTYSKN